MGLKTLKHLGKGSAEESSLFKTLGTHINNSLYFHEGQMKGKAYISLVTSLRNPNVPKVKNSVK